MIILTSESLVCYLFSEKYKSGELEPGEVIPEKLMANLKKYSVVIPITQYEKLEREAEEHDMTVQEKIFQKYKYFSEIPEEWNAIPQTS